MLRQGNMVKHITASGGGDLIAQSGQSLRIKRIECLPSAGDDYLTVSVDRVTVAFYRLQGRCGNHLTTIVADERKRNLMEFLANSGINVSIPVAEGQTLTVKRVDETGNVMLLYDMFDAADVRATDPNGSEAKKYTFLQYAKVGSTPTDDGDALIDTSLTPAEFPDFPCGKVVPSHHRITLLGIAGCPFLCANLGARGFATEYLKLVKDREVLFDLERNGIPFNGNKAVVSVTGYRCEFSLIGAGVGYPMASYVPEADPLMFDPALVFESGQELNAYLVLKKLDAGGWVADIDDQAFILQVERI